MRILDFCLSVTLGVWLAMVYFGLLWLTFKSLGRFERPAALLLASFIGRVGGVLFCFHLAAQDGRWDRFLACVAGFFCMRAMLIRVFDLRSLNVDAMNKGRTPGGRGNWE